MVRWADRHSRRILRHLCDLEVPIAKSYRKSYCNGFDLELVVGSSPRMVVGRKSL